MNFRVIDAAEDVVKNALSDYDSSHDWHHVNRVRRLGILLHCKRV